MTPDIDPEHDLPFKLKRKQFNHRIPELLVEMFDEFGDNKKYLIEYLVWMVCKNISYKYTEMKKYEIDILKIYMKNVQDMLIQDDTYGQEFSAIFSLQSVLEEKMKKNLARNAAKMLNKDS
ncbi:hypothetical protein GF325_14395 [Candidatus Bathyarchaeota archaeon]|nr:hypothetical protein [Candidatus Bathyarchaeota archaeon]